MIVQRILLFLCMVGLIVLAPWWLSLIFLLVSTLVMRRWYEGIVLGFFIDLLALPITLLVPVVALGCLAGVMVGVWLQERMTLYG